MFMTSHLLAVVQMFSARSCLRPAHVADKHRTARMFLIAFMHCALADFPVSSPQYRSNFRCQFSGSDRKETRHVSWTVPLKKPRGALSTSCNGTNTPSSRSSQITLLCNCLHIMLTVKIICTSASLERKWLVSLCCQKSTLSRL